MYVGPVEGLPETEWTLKPPKEILALKVCDMAMGSGAFLVESCRYLAERLVESWENAERERPGSFLATPDGELSTGAPTERLLPVDSAERVAIARRYVADRCLYGVDMNPMAVEMAKLSLWLITLQRDRPFNFLDHALKCGDSLLGVSSINQIENFSLRTGPRQITFATADLARYVEEASVKRRALEALSSNNATQIEAKNRLHTEAEAATAKVKALADALIGSELRGLSGESYEELRTAAAESAEAAMRKALPEFQAYARERLGSHRPFHWAVEFPEVFALGGFDAVVGNPPFMGGQKISGTLGADYRDYLVCRLAHNQRGSADLCAYFLLRANSLLRADGGIFGLLATNTIAQGDTREVGLDQLVVPGATLPRAIKSAPWPGDAALEVAHVWLYRGLWNGGRFLDSKAVDSITPFLTAQGVTGGKPSRLVANAGKSFQGSIVLGAGFVLTIEESEELLERNPGNRDVLFEYLNGDDINSRFDQSPSRWIINFKDWTIEKAQEFADCFAIVEARVKPERARVAYSRGAKERWWLYERPRHELYEKACGLQGVLVSCRVTKYLCHVVVPSTYIYDVTINVFTEDIPLALGVCESSIYEAWVRSYGSSLETRLRYTLTDCFETFAFPIASSTVIAIGADYHEYRRQLMASRREGLTTIYNRFHDPAEKSDDITRLRTMQMEMDHAVSTAYDWKDVDLGCAFSETRHGIRYAISEPARRTVLERLLALNHERYAQEMKTGLHARSVKKAKTKPARRAASVQAPLV